MFLNEYIRFKTYLVLFYLKPDTKMFFNGIRPDAEKCCGCEGCKSICPKSAIKITESIDGFILPEVNPELCIECGLCEKVCPMYHAGIAISSTAGEAYAAVNKNDAELSQSSSGGIFSLVADYVLDEGGFVAGASFDRSLTLHHVVTEDRNDISNLRGSKYLQSRIGDTFTTINRILNTGKLVYFVGTGCQVAGLKLFLRKDYENLITSDILCHGVPPQSVFDAVIKAVEAKYNGKVEKYSFRDKSVWGWSCSSSSHINIESKLKYLGNEPIQRAYFNAFIKADNYRESCYVCPYAQSNRSGDITLGDFWGVEKYLPIKDIRKGVSAILVNTPKGQQLLDRIKGKLNLYRTSISDIEQINRTLVEPTPRPVAREQFFKKFHENPEKTLMGYYKPNRKYNLVYALKRNPVTAKTIILVKKILKK